MCLFDEFSSALDGQNGDFPLTGQIAPPPPGGAYTRPPVGREPNHWSQKYTNIIRFPMIYDIP